MRRIISIIIIIACAYLVGCGGAQQKESKVISVEDYETSTYAVEAGNGQVEGLLGNVTQDELERVFSNNRRAMERCYEDAMEDLEETEGSLRFQAEVSSEGTVNHAFIMESTLGAVDTEMCMLNIVRNMTFRRAPGGVAVIYYPLELEAPYDHPPFVSWPDARIDKAVAEHRAELDACVSGQSGVHLTFYVGMGGVVLSAGAASDTLEAYDAATCAAKAVRKWSFPDPGDKLVKAHIDI